MARIDGRHFWKHIGVKVRHATKQPKLEIVPARPWRLITQLFVVSLTPHFYPRTWGIRYEAPKTLSISPSRDHPVQIPPEGLLAMYFMNYPHTEGPPTLTSENELLI